MCLSRVSNTCFNFFKKTSPYKNIMGFVSALGGAIGGTYYLGNKIATICTHTITNAVHNAINLSFHIDRFIKPPITHLNFPIHIGPLAIPISIPIHFGPFTQVLWTGPYSQSYQIGPFDEVLNTTVKTPPFFQELNYTIDLPTTKIALDFSLTELLNGSSAIADIDFYSQSGCTYGGMGAALLFTTTVGLTLMLIYNCKQSYSVDKKLENMGSEVTQVSRNTFTV